MHAITGITGKVGGEVARQLLAAGLPVRGIVRDAARAGAWAERGCELAKADMADASALTAAFKGAKSVFVLLPPQFDPAPGFPESRTIISAVAEAIEKAAPEKVVCLSTIGAQAEEVNLLTQLTLMERALRELPMPLTFLRPGWFMENAAWDVSSAREQGVIASYLQPLDKPIPMVATADVGRVAAQLLQETWNGLRIVELEGPRRVSPNTLAATFARVLDRPRACRDRRAWDLGYAVPRAKDAQSVAANAYAGRVQRGLDRFRTPTRAYRARARRVGSRFGNYRDVAGLNGRCCAMLPAHIDGGRGQGCGTTSNRHPLRVKVDVSLLVPSS